MKNKAFKYTLSPKGAVQEATNCYLMPLEAEDRKFPNGKKIGSIDLERSEFNRPGVCFRFYLRPALLVGDSMERVELWEILAALDKAHRKRRLPEDALILFN